MSQVNPPYRADVVGSFLRPKELLDARHAFQAGKLDRASLTALEDRLIKDLVEKEVKNGLKAVTDGEFAAPSGIWTFSLVFPVCIMSRRSIGRCILKASSPRPKRW